MSVKESHDILIAQESDKMIEEDKIIKEAKDSTENNGIVFLDEIDKVSGEQIELVVMFLEKVFKEIYFR